MKKSSNCASVTERGMHFLLLPSIFCAKKKKLNYLRGNIRIKSNKILNHFFDKHYKNSLRLNLLIVCTFSFRLNSILRRDNIKNISFD